MTGLLISRSETISWLLLIIVSLEDRGYKSCPTARAVLGEEEVELVVDAHHLGDSALHHVLEVRVEPLNIEYDRNISIVIFRNTIVT